MRLIALYFSFFTIISANELANPYSLKSTPTITGVSKIQGEWLQKKYSYALNNLKPVDQFLSVQRIYCADRTFLNGKEIGKTGLHSGKLFNAYSRERQYFISASIVKKDNLLEIIAFCPPGQLRHGPTSTSLKFIPITALKNTLFKDNLGLFAVIFISLAFGIVFLEFYRYFPSLKESLTYAALSLSFAVFYFLSTNYKYLLSDNDLFLKKIEYLFLFSLPPLFMLSLLQTYRLHKNKIGILVSLVFGSFTFAVLTVKNFPHLNLILRVWHLHLPFIFVLILVVHTMAIHSKENLANHTVMATAVLFFFGFIDIMGIWGIHSFQPVFHYGGLLYLVIVGVTIGKKVQILAQSLNRRMYFSLKNLNQQRHGLKREADFISKTMANISHDIKTPLSLIAIPLETLKFSGDNFTEKQRNLIERIWNNYVKTSTKIDELLAFSRDNETGIKIFSQNSDLNLLIANWTESYQTLLKDYSINLLTSLETEPFKVKMDADKIEKILTNLVNNTVLHGKEATKAYLTLRKTGHNFTLRYWDNGTKTESTNLRENKFTKFETTSIKGTGLGLYLSKTFATSMGFRFSYNDSYKRNVFELSGNLQDE